MKISIVKRFITDSIIMLKTFKLGLLNPTLWANMLFKTWEQSAMKPKKEISKIKIILAYNFLAYSFIFFSFN